MGRERRPSMEDYERTNSSYTSPNTTRNRTRDRSPMRGRSRSPRSERSRSPRYSRTESRPRRSHSGERRSRNDENRGARRPAYGGPTRALKLDSEIQVSVDSRSSSSPVRPTSKRIVIVRPRGEAESRSSGSSDGHRRDANHRNSSASGTRSQPEIIVMGESVGTLSRYERRDDSPSQNHRNVSPSRGRRDNRRRSRENRNRRNETHGNERDRSTDRGATSSRDRNRRETHRNNDGGSVYSSRRNEYEDNLERERNSSRRRRYSRENRQDDEYSYSNRRSSYDASERSHNEEEPDGSENADESENNKEALTIPGPVVGGIRPPMWIPPMVLPRPPPMFPLPRMILPTGHIVPLRPFRPPIRLPGMCFPPRLLPPPPPTSY